MLRLGSDRLGGALTNHSCQAVERLHSKCGETLLPPRSNSTSLTLRCPNKFEGNMIVPKLSAHRYNRIRHIDEQCPTWHRSVSDDILQQIGAILNTFKANKDFGLALLHRHSQLPAGFVMVHSLDNPDRDICDMERMGAREVFPSSYLLDDFHFLPYEFSTTSTPAPSSTLLRELAVCFRTHNLEDTLGVTTIASDDQLWLESTPEGGQMLVSEKVSHEPYDFDTRFVQTEWAVLKQENKYVLRVVKACERAEVGGHQPVQPNIPHLGSHLGYPRRHSNPEAE